MNIRRKTMSVVGLTLVVLVGALSVILGRVMMSGFRKVEDREARLNVGRARDAIDVQLQGIESSLFTWTQWDAAYDFVADHDARFLKENVSSTMYTGMRIDYSLFLDPQKQVLYGGGYDDEKQRDVEVPPELVDRVRLDPRLLANQDPMRSVRGIVNLRGASLYVVAAPVTNTAGTAPARGHVVFARVIDQDEVARLSATTHLAVSVTRHVQETDGVRVAVRDAHTIDGLTNLADINGQPALTLAVAMPREVYRQGLGSLRLLLLSIVVIGLVFGVVVYQVMSRLVLRRVVRISHQVVEMTESFDFTRPVDAQGRDEISALGQSINGMACAISEALSGMDRAA